MCVCTWMMAGGWLRATRAMVHTSRGSMAACNCTSHMRCIAHTSGMHGTPRAAACTAVRSAAVSRSGSWGREAVEAVGVGWADDRAPASMLCSRMPAVLLS